MIAEYKPKAVQFWNVISERLQEIENNNEADINALVQRTIDGQVNDQSQHHRHEVDHQMEQLNQIKMNETQEEVILGNNLSLSFKLN